MNTNFKKNQTVISKTSAQGLVRNEVYVVVEVLSQSTPFGTFVTYVLVDEAGNRKQVVNGHLLLEAVSQA